jgi:putative ABC transport system permease protein
LQPILYIQGYPRNPAYAIKLSTEQLTETITAIESQWKQAYAGNVFKYYFLDDFFDQQYTSERRASNIVSGLTIVSIFISCCGLFGMSLHMVDKRVKEIGIRKVLGATVMSVVSLLSRDFVKLMIVGAVLAVPVAIYCVGVWLDGYAYKMEIDVWLIVTPVALVVLLTLGTISFQTVAAAKRNPVESMKYE